MSERTTEQVRTELEAERLRLADEAAGLRREARRLMPFAAGALAAFAVLARGKAARRAVKLLWKVRRVR
jgi:uncharacterized membrane protein YebE (DUF533 family)